VLGAQTSSLALLMPGLAAKSQYADRQRGKTYRLALAGRSLRNPEAAAAETTSVDPEAAGSKTIVLLSTAGTACVALDERPQD